MKKTVRIEGMSCAHCAAHVEKALGAIGLEAKVDLAKKVAVVSGAASDAAIGQAVKDAGYEVKSID